MKVMQLAFANVRHRPGRAVGLGALAAALAFLALAGVLVTASLQSGLASLEARLGADIIVAPDTAKSKSDLESVLLDGTPGNFYMDRSYLDAIAALPGVEKASPQYYLATVKAGCCSMPVQVIGFDPETDFTVQPWIARSYGSELGREDIVTGANITGTAGSTMLFYGVECRIVARLGETGTALDNAVFATGETLQDLIAGSVDQGISVLADNDPGQVISTVQVKVADGWRVSDVADDINLHVRGATAVQGKALTAGVADGVAGMSGVVGTLAAVLGAVALAVLVVAFSLNGRQRTREFAVLRLIGAPRSTLFRLAAAESLIVGLVGAVAGVVAALVVVVGFNGAIESALGLPFLMPGIPDLIAWSLAVFAVSVAAAVLASALCARRLARVDAGMALRGE